MQGRSLGALLPVPGSHHSSTPRSRSVHSGFRATHRLDHPHFFPYRLRSQIATAFMASSTMSSSMLAAAARLANPSLRPPDPVEDLDREHGELARQPGRVERDVDERADHDQRRGLADRPRQGEDRRRSRSRGSRREAPAGGRSAARSRRARASPARIESGTARIASRDAMMTIGSTRSERMIPPVSTTEPSPTGPRAMNGEAEDPVDDRRDAGEVLDVQRDPAGVPLVLARELLQVDRGADADRDREHRGDDEHPDRPEHGRAGARRSPGSATGTGARAAARSRARPVENT